MKRNFTIGSEWLYYKIYTGVKTTDIILEEKLHAVIEDLVAKKIIDKWFFIRYKDPHEHFRIRFYSETPTNYAIVINRLYPILNDLMANDLIWKIQTDTYQREIERYGETTIEDSETIFWQDSQMIVNYVSLKPLFKKKGTELMFSFLAIDSFLNSFQLTNTQKLNLLDTMQLSFKAEFGADKTLKKELDKQYRELASEIDDFISGKATSDYLELYNIIEIKQNNIKEAVVAIYKNIEIPLFNFLNSHIHMIINRQYTSKQRMYELVIYDHLHRYYKALAFKDKV
jgi:thiopeptide-type bacteriocin biosynthesis protein